MDFATEVFLAYLFDARILAGALASLLVALLAQAAGTALGLGLALLRLSRRRALRLPASLFVWGFRGLPPLVLLLLIYFGLPQLGLRLDPLQAGLLGLSLYAAAYMSEIWRAAIESVDAGQAEAARAMGLGRAGVLGWIILPQAMRIALPPFGNEFASMMRTTSLLSVIAFEELLRATTLAINQTFRPLELYAVSALWYLAMFSAWSLIQSALETRAARPLALHHAKEARP
jgi:polar amino acid transport system permease protein